MGFQKKKYDESTFANIVANKFNTEHHFKVLNSEATEQLFTNLKNWFDEPFADTSAFPTYLVSKFTKDSSTVALSGDGGDELFGGYSNYMWFQESKNIFSGKFNFILKNNFPEYSKIGKAVNKINKYLMPELELYTKLMGGLLKQEKKQYAKLWQIDPEYNDYWYFEKFYKKELPFFSRMQYLDFHTYLHDDILTKVDRTSMAVALETRVPLLATELIEFCFSLPDNVRILNGQLKGLVKHAYQADLTPEIVNRKKKGFSIPMGEWHQKLIGKGIKRQVGILQQFMDI